MRDMKKRASTLGRQLLQGGTMGFSDEIIDAPTAAIVAALTGQKFGDVYKEARGMSRDKIAEDWREDPVTSFAGNFAGSVPFGFTKGAKAAADWARNGSAISALGKGAATGAGFGALAGAGSSSSDDDATLVDALKDRLGGSAVGAAIGAPLGSLGAALSRALSPAAGPDYSKVARKVSKQGQNKAEKLLYQQLAARPDLKEQLARAEGMNTASQNTGIDLTLAEKIAQSQSDPLLAQQKILGGNPQTAGAMENFYAARSGTNEATGSIENALNKQVQELSPNSQNYDDVAQSIIERGQKASGDITRGLVAKARPLYEQAEKINVSPEILKDPLVADAVKGILSNPEYQREIGKDIQPNSIKVLDLAYREIRDRAQKALQSGERNRARLLGDAAENLVAKMDEAAPSYKAARQIYSGQPDVLAMRNQIGNIADLDPNNVQNISNKLFSGTQQNADMTAKALGPEGAKEAAAARILNTMDTARGDPTSWASKIAPDSRSSDMLRTYAGGDQIDETLNVINQAKIGEKFRYGSPTEQLGESRSIMKEAASGATDLVTGNKIGLAKKALNFFGASPENDPAFYQDMMDLMTTEKGMDLVRKAASGQGTALEKQKNAGALIQALQSNAMVRSVQGTDAGLRMGGAGGVLGQQPINYDPDVYRKRGIMELEKPPEMRDASFAIPTGFVMRGVQ